MLQHTAWSCTWSSVAFWQAGPPHVARIWFGAGGDPQGGEAGGPGGGLHPQVQHEQPQEPQPRDRPPGGPLLRRPGADGCLAGGGSALPMAQKTSMGTCRCFEARTAGRWLANAMPGPALYSKEPCRGGNQGRCSHVRSLWALHVFVVTAGCPRPDGAACCGCRSRWQSSGGYMGPTWTAMQSASCRRVQGPLPAWWPNSATAWAGLTLRSSSPGCRCCSSDMKTHEYSDRTDIMRPDARLCAQPPAHNACGALPSAVLLSCRRFPRISAASTQASGWTCAHYYLCIIRSRAEMSSCSRLPVHRLVWSQVCGTTWCSSCRSGPSFHIQTCLADGVS